MQILSDPPKNAPAPKPGELSADAIEAIARAFVRARASAQALPAFPGELPHDMHTGYAVQDAAIALWPDQIAGWKVGLVPPAAQSAMGAARLSGPIFQKNVFEMVKDEPVKLLAIAGGFAAIEVELVVAVAHDAPAEQAHWTLQQAATFANEWRVGVEFAASPLANINELGATSIASDFGNNSGLILGPRFDSRLIETPSRLICETKIDEQRVGFASAADLPGGALEALRFLLGHLAKRGRPLRKGQWVSTGAITGVHQIFPGQRGSINFFGHANINVLIEAAVPKKI
jgi:2-keto-4-pentenoate hydratase